MGLIRAILKLPILLWLFVFGAYMYFQYTDWQTDTYVPLQQQLETTKQKLSTLKSDNKAAETFGKEKDSRVQELQHLAEEFNHALEKLPKSSDIPGVLSSLADISDRVGIEFSRFEPGKAQLNGYLMETLFKVELRGTFVQVMSFLDEVAHLKRIIVGKSVSLKDGVLRGNNTLLKAEATLVTYHFDENVKATGSAPGSAFTPTSGATSGTPTNSNSNTTAAPKNYPPANAASPSEPVLQNPVPSTPPTAPSDKDAPGGESQ